jgi:Xaa-Pro aminopeptidase
MEATSLPALAALIGSASGALTSFAANWTTHWAHSSGGRSAAEIAKREALYDAFMDEASRALAHALSCQEENPSELVSLFALVSRMRLVSSPEVVSAAEAVMIAVMDAYAAPNRTFREIREEASARVVDPLRPFGEICREDLQGRRR